MTITIVKPGLAYVQASPDRTLPVWGRVPIPVTKFQPTPLVVALELQHKFKEEDALLFWFDKPPIMPL